MRYYAVYTPTPEHWAVIGIPARDLTPDEVEFYGGIEVLKNSQCYEFVPVVEPDTEPDIEPDETEPEEEE